MTAEKERLSVLETQRANMAKDITELKNDVKQIKEDVRSRTRDLNTLTNNPIGKLKNKIIGAKAIKSKIKGGKVYCLSFARSTVGNN